MVENKIDRRNFLKLGAAVAGAAIVGSKLPRVLNQETGLEVKDKIYHVSTEQANYFSLLENHRNPIGAESLRSLPKMQGVMYEDITPQKGLLTDRPDQVIDTRTSQREYIVPRDQLEVWRENGTALFFEGQMLPAGELTKGFFLPMGEALVGGLAIMMALKQDKGKVQPSKEIDSKSKGLNKLKIGSLAAGTWAVSPFVTMMMESVGGVLAKNDVKQGALERLISRGTAVSTNIHPEGSTIFFRNLNAARQLNQVGKYLADSTLTLDKINMAYNFGRYHTGIEDFLLMGDKFIYGLMDLYPNSFWQEMVDVNGGIDILSSIPIFEPHFNRWERRVIKDLQFERMLARKVNED